MTRTSVIVGDVLALSVTWWKTFGSVREAARLKLKVTLGMVLIREGTLLSLALLVLNVCQMLSVDVRSMKNGNPGIGFLLPLSSTLVCRFMLNLKDAAYRPEMCSTLHISTIRFNTNVLIGNLGESLDFATGHDECVMEEHSSEWDGSTVMP
ncbi:hypothetical protein BC629DRAFT_1496958 [Irpex lacteus]|nr:hypothetical protein BC629DRAFT_1496958 [Irpex lacteus]